MPSSESEGVQPICHLQTLQDGRHPSFQRHSSKRRLDSKTGSERCLFDNPDLRSSSAFPPILLEDESLRVQSPPIRTLFSPMVLHETVEGCGGEIENSRCASDHLSGRHHYFSTSRTICLTSSELDNKSPPRVGVHHKSVQIHSGPDSADRRFRISDKLSVLPAMFAEFKDKGDKERIALDSDKTDDLFKSFIQDCGPSSLIHSSHLPGPLNYRVLQRLKIRHLQKGLFYSDLVPLTLEAKTEMS